MTLRPNGLGQEVSVLDASDPPGLAIAEGVVDFGRADQVASPDQMFAHGTP